jgi:hypothetical protein
MRRYSKYILRDIVSCQRNTNDAQLLRWQIIGGLDVLWEIVLITMTVALVWGLQASFFTKVQVVSSFLYRLP